MIPSNSVSFKPPLYALHIGVRVANVITTSSGSSLSLYFCQKAFKVIYSVNLQAVGGALLLRGELRPDSIESFRSHSVFGDLANGKVRIWQLLVNLTNTVISSAII